MAEIPRPTDGLAWPAACAALEAHLSGVFAALEGWCSLPGDRGGPGPDLADFPPAPGAWTLREVLDHVHLADHYLLVLVEKIAAKSARRAQAGDRWPAAEPTFEFLTPLVDRSLRWTHPEHMTPREGEGRGGRDLAGIAADLSADRDRCRALLGRLPPGQGTLHRIRMSVVDGRLDLYQYLEVIALHGERHLAQLERNRAAFEAQGG